MPLPSAEQAIVEPGKVRDYLLSPEHPVGRGKARFFTALGFRRAEWPALQSALRQLAREGTASVGEATAFGQKYRVRGTIQGPTGRTALVESAWIVLAGETAPRFITAFPGGSRA